jgi:ATP-dependent helicase HrpA
MTDGILLAEIQRDPQLRGYDTIIIDEAHERSLNIDFLLGYLHQLLPRRPDLKLIITSATIDPARFSTHFDGAPIIEVSGRTYPVEVRYRPLTEPGAEGDGSAEGDKDQITGIVEAVDELTAEGPGDILVFCSGEREIRDTADALRERDLRDTEVLPLYARLSSAEQHRVFAPHSGRRIVLATNVAETSLTVPGIRYVIDPGTARISRYSNRTKVQRLPIEPISQASANQRKGRCGRVAEGICIRLYDEEDFQARPAYTDPEILRTNLAAVILQMAALNLGDVAAFGFLDPPDPRSVRDAVQLLDELGAVRQGAAGPDLALTEVGRRLSALPVDPRLGRMLIEADASGCLREVLVIVAALSIQDPRERPTDQRKAADEHHVRFADEHSDFTAYLNLWQHLRVRQRALSGSAFRRECKAEFLHHLRVREWQDVHSQLRSAVKELGMTINDSPADTSAVHLSLLAGLLSHVGLKQGEKREYLGARGTRFVLWPGSALADAPPAWVMAAELVETSRLWARTVARIDPAWAEKVGDHLLTRSYGEPRWSAKRGSAVASEKVTLYGVPLVADRTVTLGRIDPEGARELFIRHALVDREWRSHHTFLQDNTRLLTELCDLEHRARRRDIVVDDDALFAFYDARIPEGVVSGRHFDRWWNDTRSDQPDLLTFSTDALLTGSGGTVSREDLPDVWRQGDHELRLSYRFEPGAPDDGVTVHVPLPVLNRLRPDGFDWQVPGLRAELITALIRSLPKSLRRSFVPAPEVVAAVLPNLSPGSQPLTAALGHELQRLTAVAVPADAWDLTRVPEHLRMTFRVTDGDRTIGLGKDLRALQTELARDARSAVAGSMAALEATGQRDWTFGALPPRVQAQHEGHTVEGFPALVDEGATVGVRVLLDPAEQRTAMWRGTRRLLLLAVGPPVKMVHARLGNQAKLTLSRSPHGDVKALLDDCTTCAVDALLADHGGPVWNAEDFARLRAAVEAGSADAVLGVVRTVERVLAAAHAVQRRIDLAATPLAQPAIDDARAHLQALVHPGFVTATGRDRLGDLVRYVQGIEHRLGKAGQDPQRDRALRERIAAVRDEYITLLRQLGPRGEDPAVREIRWMIEELRVSLFAQHLGTRHPVSEQRVLRAIGKHASG